MDELSAFANRLVDTALRYSLPLRLGAVAAILALFLGLTTVWSSKASLMQIPRHTIRALPFTAIGVVLVAVLVVVVFPGVVPARTNDAELEPLQLTMPCGNKGYIGDTATKTYYLVAEYEPMVGEDFRCFRLSYDAVQAGYTPSEGR